MDNCREYLENLCSYVDGEADDSICREIEKHLSDCPDCRIMVDTLRKTVKLCRDGKEEPLPEELKARMKAILEQKWKEKFGENGEDA
ncbi:MAG: zf-HC2 domain-containing protein [Candidatus Krumholzibacteria bacterium]|nr:zf-HC2 domain-containing protein [Candidatus Krumholzibacteria bacterium]